VITISDSERIREEMRRGDCSEKAIAEILEWYQQRRMRPAKEPVKI